MQLQDQTGRVVYLPGTARRIVSLVPSITETLFDLQVGELVVGRTKFCFEPKDQVEAIRIVGGTKSFHPEWIDEVSPDLILANKEENDRDLVHALMERYPVWVSNVKDVTGAIEMLHSIGEMTDSQEVASTIATNIDMAFANLQFEPVSAAYLIWNKPLMVSGGDTFIHDMMSRAGFKNVFGDRNRYPSVTVDELKTAAPEVLLLSSEPFPFAQKHIDEFQNMVPGAKVALCDGTYFSWYGSRLQESPAYFESLNASLERL